MNVCAAGHALHEIRLVATIQGPMWVWDWDLYKGFQGYCTGQDDVSQTLIRLGMWEPHESVDFLRCLMEGPGQVLDFGAHIGWFSLLAARHGNTVHAYEGDAENLSLMGKNLALHHVLAKVFRHHAWVDEKFSLPFIGLGTDWIRLVKIDLEGNERHAVAALEPVMDRVQNLVVEVSPCFNDSYPALVERLQGHGFEVFRGREPWGGVWDFSQDNFWFRRPRG